MNALSPREILNLWEAGLTQHPLERALTILAVAGQTLTRAEWAHQPLGALNLALLRLHESQFGRQLRGGAKCPRCDAMLEFELACSSLFSTTGQPETPDRFTFEEAGIHVTFRLANSHDLAAAAGCHDPASARQVLVERCVTEARRGESPIPVTEMPTVVEATLARQMAEADPQAEMALDLDCAACGHRWQAMLDIGAFIWQKLAAQARRLLREIHTLARAYGWSESETLQLSERRRAAYLELVGGLG